VAIEALVADLHPGAQRDGRQLLDGEPDRLRCRRKAAIAQRLSWPALALCHEQLGGDAPVEKTGAGLSKRSPPCPARRFPKQPPKITILSLHEPRYPYSCSTPAPPSLH